MLTAIKLLFITFWLVVPSFGTPCNCLHAPMAHGGKGMPAAHMMAKMQDRTNQTLAEGDCAHKCAAKAAIKQAHIFAAKPSEIKLPIVIFAANALGWQGRALAFTVRAWPTRQYLYKRAAPPDKTPVMLKIRLLT